METAEATGRQSGRQTSGCSWHNFPLVSKRLGPGVRNMVRASRACLVPGAERAVAPCYRRTGTTGLASTILQGPLLASASHLVHFHLTFMGDCALQQARRRLDESSETHGRGAGAAAVSTDSISRRNRQPGRPAWLQGASLYSLRTLVHARLRMQASDSQRPRTLGMD